MVTARGRQAAQDGFNEVVGRERVAFRRLQADRTDWDFLIWMGAKKHLEVTRALLGDLVSLDCAGEHVALAAAC